MDIFIVEFLKKGLGSLIRGALLFIAGIAGFSDTFSDEQYTNAGIAIATVAIAIGWSVYQKWQNQREVEKALNAPPGTPLEAIKK